MKLKQHLTLAALIAMLAACGAPDAAKNKRSLGTSDDGLDPRKVHGEDANPADSGGNDGQADGQDPGATDGETDGAADGEDQPVDDKDPPVNEVVVNNPPADSVWFGLSIKNEADHRALVLGEVLGVLSSVPQAPLALVATSAPTSIELDWNPSAEGDLLGYNVYRSTVSGSGYVLLNGAPIASPTYTDNTASPQTYYYYVVTAVDTDSNESELSCTSSRRLPDTSITIAVRLWVLESRPR